MTTTHEKNLLEWLDLRSIKLIILDFDGTIAPNRKGSDGEAIFEWLQNVPRTIRTLQEKNPNIQFAVCSNQSKKRTEKQIRKNIYYFTDILGIPKDMVFWETLDQLKKPNRSMLDEALASSMTGNKRIPRHKVLVVGDRESDQQFANLHGCIYMHPKHFFMWDNLSIFWSHPTILID